MLIAKYTEVLKNLLDNERTNEMIQNAMSTYPLYESTSEGKYGAPNIIPTRSELNNKILNYYKYREIGFETVGRFLDELETALKEIMPYYNQLYFSADQDYNIIYNVDYVRTINRNKEDNNTVESETSTQASDSTSTSASVNQNAKNVKSDTPQNELSITASDIDEVDYASEVDWNHNESTDTGSSTGSSSTTGTATSEGNNTENEETVETTKGNYGVVSAQDLIMKYRDIIINIDQQIINDPRIAELFMLVY